MLYFYEKVINLTQTLKRNITVTTLKLPPKVSYENDPC